VNDSPLKRAASALWRELRSADARGDVSQLVAEDYQRTEPAGNVAIQGRDGFARMLETAHVSLPDIHFDLDDQIEQGDVVATRWTATATQDSVWRGLAPTHRRFQFSGVTLSRFAAGQLVEEWMHWDGADALARLSAVDTPPSWDFATAVAPEQVTRRLWEEVWSGGAVDRLYELVAAEYIRHDGLRPPRHGRLSLIELIASTRAAFPDLTTVVEREVVENDRVVTMWHSTGTQSGSWRGHSSTGRRISVRGCTISRVAGAQVVEEWSYWDEETLQRQIKEDQ
jgi:predicted ester cyclase